MSAQRYQLTCVNDAIQRFETISKEARYQNDKLRNFEWYQSTVLNGVNLSQQSCNVQCDEPTEVTVDETGSELSDSLSFWSSHHSLCRQQNGLLCSSDILFELEQDSERSFDSIQFDSSQQSLSNDINEWDILRILGQGAFGEVVQVKRKSPESETNTKCYAIKILSKYQILRDQQIDEVCAEKSLLRMAGSHPFIVTLRSSWQDTNYIYLLQDFVQGGELFSQMLHENYETEVTTRNIPMRRALPEAQVQFYAACIADALHHLHVECNVVYRDLKPENVLIDSSGYPVLIDLGLAKLLSEEHEYETRTLCGTPRYVAPEQIEGMSHSFGVDHWALAVLTYEMLTGIHPFDDWDGTNEIELYKSIVTNHYRQFPLTEPIISEQAKDWVDQLLVKDPSLRLGYQSHQRIKETDLIQSHPWLSIIDVTVLRRRGLRAPWIPILKSSDDANHFDDWGILNASSLFHECSSLDLTLREQDMFKKFDRA